MQISNSFISEDSRGKRKYHPVVAIYNRQDKTKHRMFTMELFVLADGSITFKSKWAKMSPRANTKKFTSMSSSQSLMIYTQEDSVTVFCRLPDLRFMVSRYISDFVEGSWREDMAEIVLIEQQKRMTLYFPMTNQY